MHPKEIVTNRRRRLSSRWTFVLVAGLVMAVAGFYQFGWSSLRMPLGARIGAPETGLGTIFTLFVVFQTLSQFPAGWVRDRFGPKIPMLVGGLGMVAGFAGVALARTLPEAYLAYAIGGIGTGIAYTVAINTAVKWFTDRRGLATGFVAMSYSGGSFLLIPVIRGGLDTAFDRTVLLLAVVAGGMAFLAALVLRDPGTDDGDPATDGTDPTADDGDPNPGELFADEVAYTWRETIRTWQFWLLYGVFVVVNGVGLMVIGKVVSYADVLALPAAAATASASLIALADAGGVIVLGGLSDRLGRRRTVAGSLLVCGAALAGAVLVGEQGIATGFVALVAIAAFFRSPVFGIFPALVGEYYGRAHSSTNYAVLYTAKLFGGIFGGTVASALVVTLGWSPSFLLGAGFLALAGVAMTFLRPV